LGNGQKGACQDAKAGWIKAEHRCSANSVSALRLLGLAGLRALSRESAEWPTDKSIDNNKKYTAHRWNKEIIDALTKGCVEELSACGVKNVRIVEVPGAYELPLACKRLIQQSQPTSNPIDAVVAIGCLIKGDTPHFENISTAVSAGLMNVGLDTGVPVIFGVLTVLTVEQAEIRAGLKPGMHNHGPEWGTAAITMALLK